MIGPLLKDYIQEHGITQAEVGDSIGKTQSAVNKMLGTRAIHVKETFEDLDGPATIELFEIKKIGELKK